MRRVPIPPDLLAEPAPELVELPERAAHYLRNVLRCEPGERVELFDGNGRALEAELVGLDPVRVQIVSDHRDERGESPCRITLFQAVPKGDRWDLVLEKATELGVSRIVPLQVDRSVVKIPAGKADKKQERWSRIVAGAARQSGRTVVPEITAPMGLDEALAAFPELDHLVADPTAEAPLRAHAAELRAQVGVWIGPEGGFTSHELGRLGAVARRVRVGPRVLRSETAGVVLVALVQHLCGDLG